MTSIHGEMVIVRRERIYGHSSVIINSRSLAAANAKVPPR
jgi:hypothetical protein